MSLRIGAGESLGLVGESGSGKTMLALALMGLLPEGARVKGEAWLEREVEEVKEVGQAFLPAQILEGLVFLFQVNVHLVTW